MPPRAGQLREAVGQHDDRRTAVAGPVAGASLARLSAKLYSVRDLLVVLFLLEYSFGEKAYREPPGTVVRWSSGSLNYPSCAYWKDTGRRRPKQMKPTTDI